jgi:DNA-binding response OmpR family regulator
MYESKDGNAEILVADAREDLRWLYQHWLEADGYKVRVAGDRSELEAQIMDRTPELILLDLHMHGLGGLRLCRWLKLDSKFNRIPVVATSHEAAHLAARLAQVAGADSILIMPFSRIELELELDRHLRSGDLARSSKLIPQDPVPAPSS